MIPASDIVVVNPSVLAAGGNGVALNGLVLTQNPILPIYPVGSVKSFSSAADVGTYFGLTSDEYSYASVYFEGRNNATVLPQEILFSHYPEADTAAFMRGGRAGAALTLAQLQAITSAEMTIEVDGVYETSGVINLSGATSFSDAATIILAAFSAPGFTVAYDSVTEGFTFTSSTTGLTSSVGYVSSTTATADGCTTTGTVLTVAGTVTGTFNVGDYVNGTDTTNSLPAGTYIVGQLTGTAGGAGTYTISAAGSPGDLTTFTCTATGPTGAMTTSLLLTAATGAVLSVGAVASTPSAFMGSLVAQALNWGTFSTIWHASTSEIEGFALWNSLQSKRFVYVAWDNAVAALTVPDTTTALSTIITNGYEGTIGVYCDATLDPTGLAAAMVQGIAASIDFGRTNGRITTAFKYTGGVPVSITNQTDADALETNGYNFVGQWGNATGTFVWFYPGYITGTYVYADEYLNQINLNSQLQNSLLTLLQNANSVPYDNSGYALIAAACQDAIDAAVNFGSINAGVALSSSQIAEVNAAAGATIDKVLNTRGWYLQVGQATAATRAARGTPPVTLWYMDGGSVQSITVASILIQ